MRLKTFIFKFSIILCWSGVFAKDLEYSAVIAELQKSRFCKIVPGDRPADGELKRISIFPDEDKIKVRRSN